MLKNVSCYHYSYKHCLVSLLVDIKLNLDDKKQHILDDIKLVDSM